MARYLDQYRRAVTGAVFLAGLGMTTLVSTVGAAADTLNVKDIGSFFVGGGEEVLAGLPKRELTFGPNNPPITVDPNGQFEVGQMYVQHVNLVEPKGRYPLLMWHGGGLTGQVYETKPDGDPGWQMFFLHAGHDVYISDAVERGRSGWARFPEIYPGEPFFRTKEEGWVISRIGPSWSGEAGTSETFEGQQFPVDAYDAYFKGSVPRWSVNNERIQAAYDELVDTVCPCVLLLHSQAASFGFPAALKNPDKIKGVVAVEPSGAPKADVDAAALAGIPFLFVWGDFIDQNPLWINLYADLERWQTQLADAGASVTVLRLPEHGIEGNTHSLMVDRNSDVVAQKIQDWMVEQGLLR